MDDHVRLAELIEIECKQTVAGYKVRPHSPRWNRIMLLLDQIEQDANVAFDVPAYRIIQPKSTGFHSWFTVHDSAYRQTIGSNGDKHGVLMWSEGGGGPGPALYEGKKLFALMGYRMIDGWPGRSFDGHNQPSDKPLGWNYGGSVSPFAIDLHNNIDRGVHYSVEPMSPNNHNTIVPVAEAEQRRNTWTWLWTEMGLGRRDEPPAGYCKIWVAGEDTPRVNLTNIDTYWGGQHQWTWWDGAYYNSGFPFDCVVEVAATRFGRTPKECYEDKPVLFSAWQEGTGGTLTAIDPVKSTDAQVPTQLRW